MNPSLKQRDPSRGGASEERAAGARSVERKLSPHLMASVVAALLFGICAFEYFYIDYLRRKHHELAPRDFAEWTFDGSTNLSTPWFSSDQEGYRPKINEIRHFGLPGDPYVETALRPRDWFPSCLSFLLFGWMTLPFHDFAAGWTWASYALVPLWFLAVFYFLRFFFRDSRAGDGAVALASLVVTCFGDLFRRLVLNGRVNVGEALAWTIGFGVSKRGFALRVPSPYLTLLLTTSVMLGAAAVLGRREDGRTPRCLAIGACLGLLLLNHPFEWVFAGATIGVLLALTFLRPWRDYRGASVWIAAAAAAASLPILAILHHWADPTALARSGFARERWFDVDAVPLAVLGALGLRHSARCPSGRPRAFWLMAGAALVAGALVIDSPAVVGIYLQNSHYYPYANTFLALAAAAAFLELAARSEAARRLPRVLIPLVLLLSFSNTKSFAEKTYRFAALPASWENSFRWLEEHRMPEERVITLSPTVFRLIPAYTTAKQLFADGFPLACSRPTDVNLASFATALRTVGVDAPRFLAERWNRQWPKEYPALFWTGNLELKYHADECDWSVILLHQNTAAVEPARAQILRDVERAEPYKGRLLWWLNDDEAPYLRVPVDDPESEWRVVHRDRGLYLLRRKSDA